MTMDYPDYEGPKQRVYLVPEWAAKEAVDKTLHVAGQNKAYGAGVSILYAVPAAKTLYVVWACFTSYNFAAADYDHHLPIYGYIDDDTLGNRYGEISSGGGGQLIFPKPIVVPGGHNLLTAVYNEANVAVTLGITVVGYEV